MGKINNLTKKGEQYLKKIYYDPKNPASFSGLEKIYSYVKSQGKTLSKAEIKKFLEKQETYTLNRNVKHKRKFTRVVSPSIDYMWMVDLAFMTQYSEANDGYSYILFAVDTFSRYLFTVALKSKKAVEMKQAFQTIMSNGRKPSKIYSDKGSETLNKTIKKYLDDQGIDHHVSQNSIKASIVERCILTVKRKITKYMTANMTPIWYTALESITSSYNNTYHRSIKMSPNEVTKENENEVWKQLYEQKPDKPVRNLKLPKSQPRSGFKFKVGDLVRIAIQTDMYTRAYDEKFSREHYSIYERFIHSGIPKYRVKDIKNEEISGSFDNAELQLVRLDKRPVYLIEKELGRKKKKNKTLVQVKWLGWADKHNTWIPLQSLRSFKAYKK